MKRAHLYDESVLADDRAHSALNDLPRYAGLCEHCNDYIEKKPSEPPPKAADERELDAIRDKLAEEMWEVGDNLMDDRYSAYQGFQFGWDAAVEHLRVENPPAESPPKAADERELEHKMSRLIWHLTGGLLSKPGYDFETIIEAADEYIEREIEKRLELTTDVSRANTLKHDCEHEDYLTPLENELQQNAKKMRKRIKELEAMLEPASAEEEK